MSGDAAAPPEQLSPGLRYIYTSGACLILASALIRLPTCAGGRIVSLDDADDNDHVVVELAGDRRVDAEGVRTEQEIVASFAMRSPIRRTIVEPADGPHVDALVRRLTSLGWADALPAYDHADALEDAFEEAKADFDALGGWSGDPIAALAMDERRSRRRRKR